MNEENTRVTAPVNGGRDRRYLANDIREFQEIFPEAARDPKSIPPEVWEEVRNGRSLVGAYARYVNNLSRRELEALRRGQAAELQNQENAARSTGSMRPVELGLGSMDAFLRGFQD